MCSCSGRTPAGRSSHYERLPPLMEPTLDTCNPARVLPEYLFKGHRVSSSWTQGPVMCDFSAGRGRGAGTGGEKKKTQSTDCMQHTLKPIQEAKTRNQKHRLMCVDAAGYQHNSLLSNKCMEDLSLQCSLARHLHGCPTLPEVVEEMRAIGKLSVPTALTGLVLYSRAMVSMLFLGSLGELELAGGSLSIGFANITGYSVLAGLAMGMEPICGQAFGAQQRKLLGLTLQRATLLLLSASVPISYLWLNMNRILLWCSQDEQISTTAQTFATFAIPDLFLLSFLHPLRIYLRSQNITFPVTCCSLASVLLHVPLNYLLVVHLEMGVAGVAVAMVCTNLNLLACLLLFLFCSGSCKDSWVNLSSDCLRGWAALLRLAVPSCVSVCLEWWWYELMILLSGLLADPRAAVAAMGILIQATSLVYVFPSALSLAVSTRVGNELGANRPARARAAAVTSMVCAVALGLVALAFTSSVRRRWGRMFTGDAEILKLTALALPIAGMCELGNCPQTAGCGVLRGSARPSMGANINLGSFYLVGMPVAVMLGFVSGMGFVGLWLGLLAAQLSCAVLMAYALARTDWVMEAKRALELTTAAASSSNPGVTHGSSGVDFDMPTTAEGVGKSARAGDEEWRMNGEEKRVQVSESDPLLSCM